MYRMVFNLLLETGIPSKTVGVMSLLFTKTSVNITQSSAVMVNHEHERETKLDYGIRQQACSLYAQCFLWPNTTWRVNISDILKKASYFKSSQGV